MRRRHVEPGRKARETRPVLLHVADSRRRYELRALTGWSSNLATNHLVRRFGTGPVQAALRRAGAYRSTFPQGYRVGTARAEVQDPPHLSLEIFDDDERLCALAKMTMAVRPAPTAG